VPSVQVGFSITFDLLKEAVEEGTPKIFKPLVNAFWSELATLGFIGALVTSSPPPRIPASGRRARSHSPSWHHTHFHHHPFGPFGFGFPQHRRTPRPSVERILEAGKPCFLSEDRILPPWIIRKANASEVLRAYGLLTVGAPLQRLLKTFLF
jgi:hypothetical protein